MAAPVTKESIHFQAEWPKKLDPAFENTFRKVGRIFWNIISIVIFPIGIIRLAGWYLRNLALRIIVLGTPEIDVQPHNYWDLTKAVARLLINPENFKVDLTAAGKWRLSKHGGAPLKLGSPDGAKLDGAFFPGKYRKKVILFAPGNTAQWETTHWLDFLKPLDTSILFINPRGVGNSTGSRYEDGYALDIYTAAEYLIQKKGIALEDIVFAGFSMGGANTTRGGNLIQEKYPDTKIKLVNINSFSSLYLTIQTVLKNKGFFAALGRWGATLINLEMDVKKDWDKLRGEKYIFYNPKDPIIPHPAQLATAVKKEPLGKSHLIQLPSTPNHIPFRNTVERDTFYSVMRDLLEIKPSQLSSWPSKTPRLLETRTIEQVA